ncbi:hypothetical protein T439DRAFT_377028 [Meredithblackwellia eburnea MCA 4105]
MARSRPLRPANNQSQAQSQSPAKRAHQTPNIHRKRQRTTSSPRAQHLLQQQREQQQQQTEDDDDNNSLLHYNYNHHLFTSDDHEWLSSDQLESPELEHVASIHTVPLELLTTILSLSHNSHQSKVDSQRQRLNNSLVCKHWHSIIPTHNSFAIKGFKTSRRVLRLFISVPERAHIATHLAFDLTHKDRFGTNQMVSDVISKSNNLKSLDLNFLGREKGSTDSACLTVSIYDAIRGRKQLEELRISFRRVWTSLTLGGDLTLCLTKLKNLKRLHLPLIQVPRVAASFPFSPSLTHLSLHLFDDGSLDLLHHLVQSSLTTLKHLHLTLHLQDVVWLRPTATSTTHKVFVEQLDTRLAAIVAPVAPHLVSFAMDSFDDIHLVPLLMMRNSSPSFFWDFSPILAPMTNLSSFTISNSLLPLSPAPAPAPAPATTAPTQPLDVLTRLPRLRHLSYRFASSDDERELRVLVNKLELDSLELVPTSRWTLEEEERVVVRGTGMREGRQSVRVVAEGKGCVVFKRDIDGPVQKDHEPDA